MTSANAFNFIGLNILLFGKELRKGENVEQNLIYSVIQRLRFYILVLKIENPIEQEELFDEEFEEPTEKLSEYDQCRKSLEHLTADTLVCTCCSHHLNSLTLQQNMHICQN